MSVEEQTIAPHNVLKFTFSSPPFVGVKPPSNMEEVLKEAIQKRKISHIAFGFPLTYHHSFYRYQLERVHDPEIYQGIVTHAECVMMGRACRKIWPTARPKMDFVFVDPETYDGMDVVTFLSLGHRRPPPGLLEQMKEAVKAYDVLEEPGYFERSVG